MCGLTGYFRPSSKLTCEELHANAMRMVGTLAHRGPDDSGVWVDAAAGIALGHRRLSIIDLSAEGHQPMISACGRYVVAYNGEIYNFIELRRQLMAKGNIFHGHSDTEVMLAAISNWGLLEAVQRFIGIFAFALWDRQERELHLVRDRLGVKPLYYGSMNHTLLFGSELKSLRACPEFEGTIDRSALALFLRHSYVPTPYSIYHSVHKLPPGTILTISAKRAAAKIEPVPYWSARRIAEQGVADTYSDPPEEAIEELCAVLGDAVKQRMVSDVPLGALLSGGIDSSTVVALMQAQSERPIETYTIGFHHSDYNEAQHATKIASHLGTRHNELYMTSAEVMTIIPRLPNIYDEPFADVSQIPTVALSELARGHVTVALSGDGGDEVFCGYTRYPKIANIRRKVDRIPRSLRSTIAAAISIAPKPLLDSGFAWLAPILNRHSRSGSVSRKMRVAATFLSTPSPEEIYMWTVSNWQDTESPVIGIPTLPASLSGPIDWEGLTDVMQQMMYLDTVTHLPDDILTKVDRASMSIGLEVRVPILDHRVVEFAWRIPPAMHLRDKQTKWLLRQVLEKYVPRELYHRPKKGFGVPIGEWLRDPLREWADDSLSETRLTREGFLNPRPVQRKWSEHRSGTQDWSHHLWDVLMFQSWLELESKQPPA